MTKIKSSQNLNHLYSPCYYHNQNLDPERVLDKHYAVLKKESDNVRRNYFWIENIRYGSTWQDTMDVYSYRPEIPAGRPIFVYLHGVYGLDMSKDVSAFMGDAVCLSEGVLITVAHRISDSRPSNQTVRIAEACQELSQAMEMILAIAERLKSSGIFLCGHSWGAHLLGMMLSMPYSEFVQQRFSLIKGVWMVGGVYDLRLLLKTYHNNYLDLTNMDIKTYSPLNCTKALAKNFHFSPDCVINVCVAQYESPAFEEQAEEYFLALKKRLDRQKGVRVELTQFLGRDHFEVVENLIDESDGFTQEIIAYLTSTRGPQRRSDKPTLISLEAELLPLSRQGSVTPEQSF